MLIVNVAGFPANNFGAREPGANEEIKRQIPHLLKEFRGRTGQSAFVSSKKPSSNETPCRAGY